VLEAPEYSETCKFQHLQSMPIHIIDLFVFVQASKHLDFLCTRFKAGHEYEESIRGEGGVTNTLIT
jgi:hypothetical protein